MISPNRNILFDLYVTKKWSTRKCADYFKMSQPWLRKFMKELQIPARPVSQNGWYKKGVKFTPDHKQKISKALKANNAMRDKFFETHHGFKTGIRSYRQYLLRGFLAAICTNCKTTNNLIVHHIDEDRHNNLISNLKVLCASCHKKHHLSTHNLSSRYKTK